ncbi:Uncharacterised protein [uncultured archaeon]|nr:Uncharacterised protein [uncultured archaeon]
MIEIAESINSFAKDSRQSGFESPKDDLLEIPVSEINLVLKDLTSIYNSLVETLRNGGVERGRELARTIENNTLALKAEKDPIQKMLLLNAFIKQLNNKIRGALNSKVHEGKNTITVSTKIKARAIQIIDYLRIKIADEPQRKEISLDSSQCRILFSSKDGDKVSRRDTIRAMARAWHYWPDLRLEHRPNDGRMTMRLIGSVKDLSISPEFEYKDDKSKGGSIWQRSRLDELSIIFGFTQPKAEDF